MRIAGYEIDSLIDGPGINLVVFFQGCKFNCPGCQNPETHALDGGHEATVEDVFKNLTGVTTGITLSGGEPTLQSQDAWKIIMEAKKRGLQTMLYTGMTEEEWADGDFDMYFNRALDYIKFGRYDETKRDTTLQYRGSSNQKVYKVEGDKLVPLC